MTRPEPQGVERVSLEEHPEKKVGNLSYQHRLDPSQFRKDRDFQIEWVDGPVRFVLERDDHGDYWTLEAQPAGKVTRMRDGYEKDSFSGSVSGGGYTQRTTISTATEGFQESFNEGDIIYVKTSVNLWANPLEIRAEYEKEPVGHVGSFRELLTTLDTKSKDHRVNRNMVKSQVSILARHVAERTKFDLTTEKGRERAVENLTSTRHYENNWVLKAALDTAYILGLREETAYATSVRKNDYPCSPNEGDPHKLSNVAKWVGEKVHNMGLIDKPKFIRLREKRERDRQHQREHYQNRSSPPQKPIHRDVKEKDNICPNDDCGGRYHKKDLVEKDFDQNYSSGIAYHCPDCDSIVAGDTRYQGPEPTMPQTRAGF